MAPRQPHVEIYRDRRGEYRWRLRAGNGEVVATGEGHGSSSNARRAWRTVERLVFTGAGDDGIEPLPIRTGRRRA